uniref:Uncharacterized protein n=1 Tax=Setaria italica TaxID=4555 RepID=K3YNL7_SETIT
MPASPASRGFHFVEIPGNSNIIAMIENLFVVQRLVLFDLF